MINTKWILIIVITIMILVNYCLYPIADALKYQMRGSDQDDALIQTGLNLIQFKNPYDVKLYTGNPISPGPGLIILTLPFTITGLYFLLTPIAFLFTGYAIKKISGKFLTSNIFLILICSSLSFWDLMVVGSDMLIIGCLFVLCLILIYYNWDKNFWVDILCILLTSLTLTSRVIFVFIIPIIGIFLWKRNYLSGIKFVVATLSLTFLLHYCFYIWDPDLYSPFHILKKGGTLMSVQLFSVTLFFSFLGVIITFLKVKNNLFNWLFYFWLCLTIPLSFVSFAELMSNSFNLKLWEGANYLMITFPIFIASFAISFSLKIIIKKNGV